jgi:hypothetical protein
VPRNQVLNPEDPTATGYLFFGGPTPAVPGPSPAGPYALSPPTPPKRGREWGVILLVIVGILFTIALAALSIFIATSIGNAN